VAARIGGDLGLVRWFPRRRRARCSARRDGPARGWDGCQGSGDGILGNTAIWALAEALPPELLERVADGAALHELAILAGRGSWPDERRLAISASVLRAFAEADTPQWMHGIVELAPRLPMPLLRDALAILARRGYDEAAQYIAPQPVHAVLSRLAELGEPWEALAIARTIAEPSRRFSVLCGLIPHLPPPLRDPVIAELLAYLCPRSRDDTAGPSWESFGEMAATMAHLGHGAELAEAARDHLQPDSAFSVWMIVAPALDAAQRRALLADAVEVALTLHAYELFDACGQLLAFAADIDRRGLIRLFIRSLRRAPAGRAALLFSDDTRDASLWTVRALQVLGDRAAIVDAARACIEVAQWFP
jgi:hypothetical protein